MSHCLRHGWAVRTAAPAAGWNPLFRMDGHVCKYNKTDRFCGIQPPISHSKVPSGSFLLPVEWDILLRGGKMRPFSSRGAWLLTGKI